jgi:hypothetical protein
MVDIDGCCFHDLDLSFEFALIMEEKAFGVSIGSFSIDSEAQRVERFFDFSEGSISAVSGFLVGQNLLHLL